MHDMFNMDGASKSHFDWKDLVKSGLSVKDAIAPTAFAFKNSRTFQMGDVEVSLRDGAYSDAKYSVSLKASAGSVEVDGRYIKGSEYSFGSGSKYIIHIKSSAGSVKFDTNR